MILLIDHLIFGNGFGLRSPHCDNRFYWLGGKRGELYTFSPGFGAQLFSVQWTHPIPGERRILANRNFTVLHSERRWGRVMVAWAMQLPKDTDGQNEAIRKLEKEIGDI